MFRTEVWLFSIYTPQVVCVVSSLWMWMPDLSSHLFPFSALLAALCRPPRRSLHLRQEGNTFVLLTMANSRTGRYWHCGWLVLKETPPRWKNCKNEYGKNTRNYLQPAVS